LKVIPQSVFLWGRVSFNSYDVTGVHSYTSVCHLFSFYILIIVNLHQPIHEAQIYFVFLSVGNPKTVLKGGTWAGFASSLTKLWIERWLVRFLNVLAKCVGYLNWR